MNLSESYKNRLRELAGIRNVLMELYHNIPRSTFWAWVSPDNKFYQVPKLKHKDLIMRVYKDSEFGWDYDRVFEQAMRDGWVRVIYEYLPERFKGELSLNGHSKERVKDVLADMFLDLVKYGNNSIYIDAEEPKFSASFSTFDSEGKDKFLNFVLTENKILKESTSSKYTKDILYGLKQHAKYFENYKDFEDFYSIKGNHGIYYHLTNTPQFKISQETGPRDMSSMASGKAPEKGALMVTTDLGYWDFHYNNYDPDDSNYEENIKRNYVAIIDLSELSPNEMVPTQRGFGHEIYLKPYAAKKAKVIKVLNIKDARNFSNNFDKIKPNRERELKKLWSSVHEPLKENKNINDILSKSPEEIIKYVGNDTSGFNSREDAVEELNYLLNTNFPHGLKNIPNEVILYRVVLIEDGEKINEDKVGEHFVSDPKLIDLGFLEKIGVIDNWSEDSHLWLLKCLTSKENVDIDRTIGNRLLYPREHEFTVFDSKKIKVLEKKEIKKSKLSLSENTKQDDYFIFHGTNNAAAYHIQKHGGMKLNAANNNEPYISFTSDMKVAQYYATMKGGSGNGVILRMKKTPDFSLSPKYKKNKGHEWITTREIPLQELEIKTPIGWVSLANWDIIDRKVLALSENKLPDMQSMLKKYKLRYPKDNILMVVNINKLLARHKHDEPDYAFDTKETSDYPGRVDRAKEYWTNYAEDPRPISPKDGTRKDWGNMTFEAPYVTIYNGKLGFSDGRHRVIAMKELGYDNIIIEVPKTQVNQFSELK